MSASARPGGSSGSIAPPPDVDPIPRWVAPVAILGAWTLFFAPALIFGRVFYFRDLFFFHRPLREVVIRALASGEAPYLNVGLNLGQPILADPSYSVFYPANVLYLVLPFNLAWNLVLSGHSLWAVAGAFFLARALGAQRAPSLAGAFAFAFSGPLVSSLNSYSLLLASSWTPWVFLCALAAWRRGGAAVPLTALASAVQALACEPTVSSVTAGLVAAYWIVGLVRTDERRVRITRGLSIAVIATLVACAQLVPTLAWLPQTDRAAALPFRESAAWWSLHPERLPEILASHVNGNAFDDRAASFWSGHLSDAGYPYVPRLYLGWLPLVLAPLAWRARWGKASLAFGVGGFVLALGHHLPGYAWVHSAVPILWITRYPEKFTLFGALGLALALALGASAVRVGRWIGPAAVGIALLAATASLALFSTGVPASGITATQEALRNLAILRALGWGVLATFVGLLFVDSKARPLAAALVPIVALLDVAAATREAARTRAAEEDARRPDLLRASSDLREARILPLVELQSDVFFRGGVDPYALMQEALYPYSGLRWGIRYGAADDISRMMSALSERRRRTTIEALHRGAFGDVRAAGIGAIVSVGEIPVAGLDSRHRVRAGDLQIEVAGLPSPAGHLARFESGTGRLDATELSPHRIEVAVEASTEGVLVVTREAIPGWTALLDGEPVAIAADSLGLLRVEIPEGRHALTLRYAPPGLRAGLLLSLVGLALAIASLWHSRAGKGRISGSDVGW